ncbi:CBS domain-containing protein [Streptacidiphilus sp. EB103A]|uniref:CBS domain-containing protein n=1 Tax=Streptacidiphilus sp. EB103A TaxID=3156275 RepID=UPI003511A3D9
MAPPPTTPDHQPTAADIMVPAELQASDHTAVDKALVILNSAHADYLLIRGEDGHCVGLITQADLDAYRAQPWYTQQTRLRDLEHGHDTGPFAHPDTPASTAAATMQARGLNTWPVVDADGYALGVITTAQLRTPAA